MWIINKTGTQLNFDILRSVFFSKKSIQNWLKIFTCKISVFLFVKILVRIPDLFAFFENFIKVMNIIGTLSMVNKVS